MLNQDQLDNLKMIATKKEFFLSLSEPRLENLN